MPEPTIIPEATLSTGNPFLSPQNLALPHVFSFASLYNTATSSYSWRWDEAYKYSREAALSMRRDAFLMSLLWERTYPVIMMDWSLETEDPKDAKQKEIAKKYTKAIKKIPHFRRYLKSALDAIWYGRAGVQQQWGKVEIEGEPFWTVNRHVPVNGDKIQYSWDGVPRVLIYSGEMDALQRQGATVVMTDRYTALELDKPYWRDRFLIHAHDVIDADFFDPEMAGVVQGVGIRHWVFWLDWIKKEISTWMMDYMERVGMGMVIFYYEEGNAQSRAEADKLASTYGRSTRIVWPRSSSGDKVGPGIEVIQTNTSASEFVLGLMNYFDSKIQRFVTGQTEGAADRPLFGAGEGAAKLKKNQQQNIVSWDCDNLGESLTTDLLAPMIRFNEGKLDFDLRFRFAVDDPDPATRLAAARVIFDMGVPLKTDQLRGWAGAEKPEEDDETVAPQFEFKDGPDGEQPPKSGGSGKMAAVRG